MEPETPVVKYAVVAVLVIIVCFGLGYFVLGPSAQNSPDAQVVEAPPPALINDPRPAPAGAGTDASVVVQESTKDKEEAARKAEEQRKKDEERRKKRDEERRKKREDEEKKQQEAIPAVSAPDDGSGDALGAARDPDTPKERGESPVTAPREEPGGAPTVLEPAATPTAPARAEEEQTSPRRRRRDRDRPDQTEPPERGEREPRTTPPPAPDPTPAAPPSGGTGSASNGALYRVRVGGGFDSRTRAESLAMELNGKGYATRTATTRVGNKTVYHVQVGAFRDKRYAQEKVEELKANGYDGTSVSDANP